MNQKFVAAFRKHGAAGAAALLMTTVGGAEPAHAQTAPAATASGEQTPGAAKFFCNTAALNPTERAYHQRLTEKLIAARTAVVELPRGYEFQFHPEDVSVADAAQWVVAEEKCCPFFNFHIDLEKQGTLVCVGLTGEEGIKQFIRSEFRVPEQK
jgi:hypothetical protein